MRLYAILPLLLAFGCSIRSTPSQSQFATSTQNPATTSQTPPATPAELPNVSASIPILLSPISIAKASGDLQTALAGTTVVLGVTVYDQNNNPTGSAAQIDWTILTGGGALSNTSSTNGSNGVATITLTLGSVAGINTVKATLRGKTISVTFTVTGSINCGLNRPSCQSHYANGCVTDGVYPLSVNGSNYNAYCLMTVDGGGWTAFFAGLNGSPNVFARFDQATTVCPLPASQCLRMAPPDLTPNDWYAGSCGAKMVKYLMPQTGVTYIQNGTQAVNVNLTNQTVVRGNVSGIPTVFWTGNVTDYGWRLQYSALHQSFASSYSVTNMWNQCDLVDNDTSSPIYLFYKRTNIPFTLSGVTASNLNTVQVQFSDRADLMSATATSNYVLTDSWGNSIRVTAATLNAGAKSVTLIVANMVTKQTFTLTVNNVSALEKITTIPNNSVRTFQVP